MPSSTCASRRPICRAVPAKRVVASGLLTVGTDCCVGKMFTALAIDRDMRKRGLKSSFRATGQTGILIEGSGIAVDAVVSDFLSGSTEVLTPANDADHWDVIEGQGSLFHPAYAAVSLGLLHGAQADALVLCHELGRTHVDGDYPDYPLPELEEVIATNEKPRQAHQCECACNRPGSQFFAV